MSLTGLYVNMRVSFNALLMYLLAHVHIFTLCNYIELIDSYLSYQLLDRSSRTDFYNGLPD